PIPFFMAGGAPWGSFTMASMRAATCFVASPDLSARRRTSSATTANPRPATAACAASMAAFRESSFILSAVSLAVAFNFVGRDPVYLVVEPLGLAELGGRDR